MANLLTFEKWGVFSDTFEPYRLWTVRWAVPSLELLPGDKIMEMGPFTRDGTGKAHWHGNRFQARREEEGEEDDVLVLCSQSLFRFADLGDDGLCRGGPDKGCGVIVSAIDVVVDRLD